MSRLTLPASLIVNDAELEIELTVHYDLTSYGFNVTMVVLGDNEIELTQDQLEVIEQEITYLITGE